MMITILPLRIVSRLRTLIIAAILSVAITNTHAQTVLLTDGFEGGLSPNGWTVQNFSTSGNNWYQYFYTYNTGSYSAANFQNVTNGSAWLFSKPLNLTAGKSYVLRYYAKVDMSALLKVTIGNAANLQSQQRVIRSGFASGFSFVLFNDTVVCEQTGNHYLGFNNYSTSTANSGTYLDDVSFTELNLPNCSTVSAGSVSSNISNICANAPFTLTNNGATANTVAGIRYAWQKSTDGVNWSNISNGFVYQPSIQVSQTVPTWYRLTDTCTVSGATAVSNALYINNFPFLACYCLPGAVNCFGSASFTNVTVANSGINNNTACSANGYGNFSGVGNIIAYKEQNIYIQHTINNPNNYYPYYVGVWVDMNQNGIFEETEFSSNGPFTTNTASSQFYVPATALTGETRMRIKVNVFGNLTANQACITAVQSGETEDYKVTIGTVTNCSGPVSAGTIAASGQTCPNTNFTITATNATVYQGQMRYAWQVSADNSNWTNLSNTGYLINPLTTSQNTALFYRLTDTCLATGQTAISNVLSVGSNNIFGCYCVPQTSDCSIYGIDSVSFNTIRNPSACGANGYGNFTAQSTTLTNGTNLPIYIKLKSPAGTTKYASVWIDFNRNGLLDNNERVFNQNTTGTFLQGNITIPYNVKPGEALMRIMMTNGGSPFSACSYFFSGETEDYKVILNTVNPVGNKFSYHVKRTATGLNDGSNWANAFTSLATAFTYMQTGDTVKIAKGTYTPGTSTANTFALKDSVIILGGYPDTGNPTNADRNSSDHPTILSGEIGSTSTLTDNTLIIVTASNVKGFYVDGVIMEKAYGYPSNNEGSVHINASTGTIKNTVIRSNINGTSGGTLKTIGAKLTLLNCVIENNEPISTFDDYKALNITAKSDVSLINSVVAKNKGRYPIDLAYSTLKITNSTFFKNFGFSSIHDTSSLVVENAIFYFNGNNFNADSTEFKTDIYSTISVNNSITEVYNTGTANSFGLNPRFADTARITGADNKYFTSDDGLRLVSPCSPAINIGNNGFVAAVATDITGAPRISSGTVDLGAYEVQGPIAPQPAVLYVNKAATGLNNGSSWQNAFTDLQVALAACSDTIKVAKGIYTVSLTDPTASIRLTNNRVLMGGYPDTGNPTNADINTVLYPSQIDGRMNATEKCYNIISAVNNDSTCRIIGFTIINSAPPVQSAQSNYATIEVSNKSNPYFENITLNSVSNQAAHLILVTDESRPTFYKCTIFNRFTSQNSYDGARSITVTKNSNPLFRQCYIGRDTTVATTPPNFGAHFSFTNTGGTIDSCHFFRARHDAVVNQNSNTVIQNTVFTKGYGRSIFNIGATSFINNCIFNDTAYSSYNEHYGGAMANTANSNATVANCQFNNSYNYRYGAAVSNENSNILFKNCAFKHCISNSDWGILYNNVGKMALYNCIAYNDGISPAYFYIPSRSMFLSNGGGGSRATLSNCTIMGTTAANSPIIMSGTTSDTLQLYNSILWRYGYAAQQINMASDVATVNNNNTAICDIRNSLLYKQPNTTVTNTLIGINPKLTDFTNIEGMDRLLYSSDDGMKPTSGSPAINAGNNGLNPEALDMMGANRVFNGTIDIGAYELQGNATTARTYYVRANAAAGGDGLSWATAYNSLQMAVLNNNADTIKVAQGLYKPASVNRDSCFNIYRGLVLLGGYPNTGNPTDAQRNPTAYPSVLSGDIGQSNDSTDNSYSVVQAHCADTTVLIDGFTIERGNFDRNHPIFRGGGAICALGNKMLAVNNCILQNNYSIGGGGLFSHLSTLNISKTVFRNNNSQRGGGFGILDYYTTVNGNPWAPVIQFKKTVFAGNKGGAGYVTGAGVIAYQSNIRFENTVVYKNEGSVAGFHFTDHAYVSLVNCLFAKNNNTVPAPGVAILSTNPYTTLTLNTSVYNTIFHSNTVLGFNPSYTNSDFNWRNGNAQQETIPYQNLAFSATAGNQTGNISGGISSGSVTFKNIDDGPGPDGVWMTPDDGLQAGNFSNSIDKGSTAYTQNITQDILDSARIKNLKVDMGPYEGVTSVLASLCPPNDTATFTSTFTGAGYQWQVDTGNAVFTDIADNFYYTGTNTATLRLSNIPSSWYGYRYRCLLPNGTFDKVSQLKFAATWTGAVSNAWENPGNWSCGRVPDQYTDVTINSAATVVINSSITIRSLRLNFGANVTVTTGNVLTVLN